MLGVFYSAQPIQAHCYRAEYGQLANKKTPNPWVVRPGRASLE